MIERPTFTSKMRMECHSYLPIMIKCSCFYTWRFFLMDIFWQIWLLISVIVKKIKQKKKMTMSGRIGSLTAQQKDTLERVSWYFTEACRNAWISTTCIRLYFKTISFVMATLHILVPDVAYMLKYCVIKDISTLSKYCLAISRHILKCKSILWVLHAYSGTWHIYVLWQVRTQGGV